MDTMSNSRLAHEPERVLPEDRRGTGGRPRSARILLMLAVAVGGVAGLSVFVPRRAHLRSFEPAKIARIETAMWRDYYQKDYPALFRGLYQVHRSAYGFSPWDSVRLAWLAARAAARFQPSRSRAEARAAEGLLRSYYRVIRQRSGERFDPAEAARHELDWWRLRREEVPPEEYGLVVARVSEIVYGQETEAIRRSGVMRADAMRYRDERSGHMRPEDWNVIQDQLTEAYRTLLEAVREPAAPDRASRRP